MQQITHSEEKKMTVADRKAAMPYEITADGEVIGIVKSFDDTTVPTLKTKCPNCGLVYDAKKPDGKPTFFTLRHQ